MNAKFKSLFLLIIFTKTLLATPATQSLVESIYHKNNIDIQIPRYISPVEKKNYLNQFSNILKDRSADACAMKLIIRVDRENYGYPFNTMSWSFSSDIAFFSIGYDKNLDEVNMNLYSGSRSGEDTAKAALDICRQQELLKSEYWGNLYDLKIRFKSGVPRFLTAGARPGKNFHKYEPTYNEVFVSLEKVLNNIGSNVLSATSQTVEVFVSNPGPKILDNGTKIKEKAFEYKVRPSKYFLNGVYQEEENFSYQLVYRLGYEFSLSELLLSGYLQ